MKKFYNAGSSEEQAGGGTEVVLKAVKQVGDELKGDVAKLKSEITTEVENKLKAVKNSIPTEEEIAKLKNANADLIKSFDELKARTATAGIGAGGQTKSFSQELNDYMGQNWKQNISEFRDNHFKKGFHFELQAKAVGNMAAANLTGSYYSAQTVAGVVAKPFESVHLRDVLPVGQTDKDTIRYVVDNGGEGGPAMVAPGGLKPQIDRDLEIKDTPVRKIATYFRLPEEMIDDIPYIQSFLSQIGVEEVMVVEDSQILFGDGTGQNLNGLYTTATAFARPAGVTQVTDANEFDILRAARTALSIARFTPSVAVVSPADFYNMESTKDTTNNYVLSGGGNGLLPVISGLRMIVHNTMTPGSFLVGDPRTTAIFDRAGTTVRVFDQDQDNAIRNLVTVVIEKRLALVNYRPAAWVKGTFAAAEAALEAI